MSTKQITDALLTQGADKIDELRQELDSLRDKASRLAWRWRQDARASAEAMEDMTLRNCADELETEFEIAKHRATV